jgi:hypothetical protein
MKHNDLQLLEMLKLARSCLKYDHLPGEPTQQDFFDRFSRESEAESKTFPSLSQFDSTPTTSTLPGIEELLLELQLEPPLEPDVVKDPDLSHLQKQTTLKLQISQIEAATAKLRNALTDTTDKYYSELKMRVGYEKTLQSSETELQKLRKQKMQAVDMVKRQDLEIKELHKTIKKLSAPPELPSSTPESSICAPPGKPKTGRPRPATLKSTGNSSDPSAMQSSVSSDRSRAVDGPNSVALTSMRSATPDTPGLDLLEIQTGLSRRHVGKTYSKVLASRPGLSLRHASEPKEIEQAMSQWKLFIP